MINKAKAKKLVAIYLYICDLHESQLKYSCDRFSIIRTWNLPIKRL